MTETQKSIINIIIEEMGLEPESLGDMLLKTSIRSLLNKTGHISEEDLLLELNRNPNTIKELIEEVKVPETWFLRDKEAFNYLEKFTKEAIINKKNLPLRILSAPCSTGEEAYSIAITMKNAGLTHDDFNIIAVDISDVNLSKASKGVYTKSSLRALESETIEKYFIKNDFRYQVVQHIKNSNIDFRNLNLIKDFYKFSNKEFDVIFFKNLLIYLNESSRQYILSNIKRVLKDDGVLFVGVSELNYFIRNGFETINHNLSFACRLKKHSNPSIQDNRKLIIKREISKKNNLEQLKNKNNTISEKVTASPIIDNNKVYNSEKIKKMMDLGKYNEVEIEIDFYIKENINNYEIYFNKGLIKYVEQNYSLAKEYFLKSLYLEPNNYDTLIYLSLIEKELGFNDKSEVYRLRAEKVYNRGKNE